ncbi:MAG TPA: class I SAM-dependent methyltransferase [Thermoanaerobaculia bacterium]|nr:class I SAM-dependent methyltransferase [Thermoanaerobaculia bacterium]
MPSDRESPPTFSLQDSEARNREYYERFWSADAAVYEAHPTSRHRKRFIVSVAAASGLRRGDFVFDYGCGTGMVLRTLRDRVGLDPRDLGGCDIAAAAVARVARDLSSATIVHGSFPEIDRPIRVAVCSEVIEHTPEYRDILRWLFDHLAPGGSLVLTTAGTPMDAPDVSYGHTQHFRLPGLRADLQQIGFEVVSARRWGFPFFSLQKLATRMFFDQVRQRVIEGGMGPLKRRLFAVAYRLYFVHDRIPWGPQIFVVARRPAAGRAS